MDSLASLSLPGSALGGGHLQSLNGTRRAEGTRPADEVPALAETETALLDRLQSGIVLFDVDLHLLWYNDYARHAIDSHRGVEMRGRLRLRNELDDARFSRLLEAAASGRSGAMIARFPTDPPITLIAFPLDTTQRPDGNSSTSAAKRADGRSPGAVAVVLRTRSTLDSSVLHTFASLYGLSRAETRVLAALVEDGAPAHIATSIGVGIRTIRTQLSSIYSKVGVDSQRELVTLLLSFPPFTVS